MSHITTVETQIRDIEALREACEALGCQLEGPGQIVGFFRDMGHADHVIKLPGTNYTVGLVRQPDGSYSLNADLWAGHVERVLGQRYGRLLQEYALRVVTRSAAARGRQASVTREKDGRIVVRIRG